MWIKVDSYAFVQVFSYLAERLRDERQVRRIGLRAAVNQVLRKRSVVQRCMWHKRENVVSYLPKSEQAQWRWRLGLILSSAKRPRRSAGARA